MFIVNKLADIDMDTLVSYAGGCILTNDVDAIKPLDTRDIVRSSYLEEDIIKADIEEATGITRYTRGLPPLRKETATSIVRLQSAAQMRFDAMMKMLEYGTVRELSTMFLTYIRKYLPPEKFAQITGFNEFFENGGPLFYMMPIEEIIRNYHFRPVGSTMTGIKELRTQQLLQAFAIFSKLPFVNLYEFAKIVLRDGFNFKNVDQLLLPPQSAGQPIPGQPQPPAGAQGEGSPITPPEMPGGMLQPQAVEELATAQGGSRTEGVNTETLLRGLAGLIPTTEEELGGA